jgi:hypothetical protein
MEVSITPEEFRVMQIALTRIDAEIRNGYYVMSKDDRTSWKKMQEKISCLNRPNPISISIT